MPYFSSKNINVLFIHIPKTGGSSVDNYFAQKINKTLDTSLYYEEKPSKFYGVSLQHQTLQTIKGNPDFFKINWNNITLMTIVRNPYTRILSEVFWRRCHLMKHNKNIKMYQNKEEVELQIKNYINLYKNDNNVLDNHMRPQYEFLIDLDNNINKNIIILRTEKLTELMKKQGWNDFNFKKNESIKFNPTDWLTPDSISLINEVYSKDFEYFGYEKIQ